MRIIIIGAGILGAAIAWSLGRRGAKVTVVDDRTAPGEGATAASFSWINACHGNRPPYFGLRMHSLAMWPEWARRFPSAGIRFGGGLSWELSGAALHDHVREHSAWGYGVEVVAAEAIRRLEPSIAAPPAEAALAAMEGAAETPRLCAMLLADAGVEVMSQSPVTRILHRNGSACGVATATHSLEADAVVVAAGTGSPALLSPFGFSFPMRHAPGLTAVADAGRVQLSRILVTPEMEIRQRDDGRLLYTLHIPGQAGDAFDGPQAVAEATEKLRQLFGEPAIRVTEQIPALRPIPGDGFPSVGPVPGAGSLFMAVSHSGVTLAPAIGAMLAGEIMEGAADAMLAPYRPERFSEAAALQA